MGSTHSKPAEIFDRQERERAPVREFLANFSAARARGGFTPTETASFIFSLKQPVFEALRREFGQDAEALAAETWRATELLDALGLLRLKAEASTKDIPVVVCTQGDSR